MIKVCIYAQTKLQHLWCWNRLEKLALIFLYNFHREHSLLKSIIKKLSPKINVKNIKNRVFFFFFFFSLSELKVQQPFESNLSVAVSSESDDLFNDIPITSRSPLAEMAMGWVCHFVLSHLDVIFTERAISCYTTLLILPYILQT